jgi:hypothetical protein
MQYDTEPHGELADVVTQRLDGAVESGIMRSGTSTARSSLSEVLAVRSADVSTLLIRARSFDCCSMGTPIWCAGVGVWLW